MKYKILNLFIVMFVLFMIAGCSSDQNYGGQLPPELPDSVPIVAGDIVDSRRTTFETGQGFTIAIQTQLSYQDTIQFYEDSLKENGYRTVFKEAASLRGTPEKMMTFEAHQGTMVTFGEIIDKSGSTYVNLAVHLGN